MQGTAHAGTPTAHQDSPLRSPLEQAPPRSRARSPSGRFRPVRGATPPTSGPAPLEGSLPPSSGSRPARGSVPPSAGARHAHGRPARVRRPRTRAFNALTPQDGAIMRPGLAPRCRRTNSPGRSPSPPLWGGTVRYGRCQSHDTARPLQYG
jgi:hypothetical protein